MRQTPFKSSGAAETALAGAGSRAPRLQSGPRPAARLRGAHRTLLGGSTLSISLHLLLILLLVFYWPQHGGKSGARTASRALLIVSLEQGTENTKVVQPPNPKEDEQHQPPPPPMPLNARVPDVIPTPPHPTAPTKPKTEPSHAPAHAAALSQANANNADKQKSQVEVDPNADEEAFLEGVRAHWLQPPGTHKDFHCRIKINYQAGGIITAVTVQEGCGGPLLDDSVERAIWKTQPLPIPSAQNKGGNLIVEFTP